MRDFVDIYNGLVPYYKRRWTKVAFLPTTVNSCRCVSLYFDV